MDPGGWTRILTGAPASLTLPMGQLLGLTETRIKEVKEWSLMRAKGLGTTPELVNGWKEKAQTRRLIAHPPGRSDRPACAVLVNGVGTGSEPFEFGTNKVRRGASQTGPWPA